MEELSKEKRWIHHTATVPVPEEKLSQIQKEMEDQEVIIQGYQQVYHTAYIMLFSSLSQKESYQAVTSIPLKIVVSISKTQMKFRCDGCRYVLHFKSVSCVPSLS